MGVAMMPCVLTGKQQLGYAPSKASLSTHSLQAEPVSLSSG